MLAAGRGVAASAQQLEECFTDTVVVSPPEPDPGDVVKVVFYPCGGGTHDYAIRFYGESGGYRLLESGSFEGYRHETYVSLPQEPGYIEIELDGSVLKRVSVGGASAPGVTTTTATVTKDVLDLDYRELAVLGGIGVVGLVGLAMALGRR